MDQVRRSQPAGRIERILVYKRTHNGDPDQNGCFGAEDCMGSLRNRVFDAVIGVGGIGVEAQANGIDSKVNWIGIGPHKNSVLGKRGPDVTFDHFLDFGTSGPDFRLLAPKLAKRMYSSNVRYLMDRLLEKEYGEAMKILEIAKDAPPSSKANLKKQKTSLVPAVSGRTLARRCT